MSEVRDGGRACQAAMAQKRPRGATSRPRSGMVAKRNHPTPEVRGCCWEELPHTRVQGQR